MKTLVVYESFFHNTEFIAKEIGKGLAKTMDANVLQFEDVKPEHLANLSLLVIGSPTQRFGPTEEITKFIHALPAGTLKGIPVAVFDTRMDKKALKNWLFRVIVENGGYAGKKLMAMLVKAGAKPLCEPEGFAVLGQEGPLKPGELERAAKWGESLAKQAA